MDPRWPFDCQVGGRSAFLAYSVVAACLRGLVCFSVNKENHRISTRSEMVDKRKPVSTNLIRIVQGGNVPSVKF